jgi:hypothetical protein
MGSGLVCGTAVSAALAGGTVDPYFTFMLRCGYIFKRDSPSCGMECVKVYQPKALAKPVAPARRPDGHRHRLTAAKENHGVDCRKHLAVYSGSVRPNSRIR